MKKKIIRSSDDIPTEGSLSLLALGHEGLMMWRQKRLGMSINPTNLVGPVIDNKEIKVYVVGNNEEE